jgi:hypothetical protein
MACDFQQPEWEIDLILPFNSDTITFQDLLPPGVLVDTILV